MFFTRFKNHHVTLFEEYPEKNEIDYKKIFDNIEAFCDAVKRGMENASFEDRRKIVELLVEEVKVTNGKIEIAHILPLTKKGNLQLQYQDSEIRGSISLGI